MTICWVNGKEFAAGQPCVRPDDLGLQRGYAAFEFLRTEGGSLFQADAHFRRLQNSAKLLQIEPAPDIDELADLCQSLVDGADLVHPAVRILYTGGYASMPASERQPNLIILTEEVVKPPSEMYTTGIVLRSFEFQRELPAAKTNNYMNAFRLESWKREHRSDDVLYFRDGNVTECPRSNFFAVVGGRVVTPDKDILSGITRGLVLQIAQSAGVAVEQRRLALGELGNATEAFITSTSKGILPVRSLDDHQFSACGAVTSALMRALEAYIRSRI